MLNLIPANVNFCPVCSLYWCTFFKKSISVDFGQSNPPPCKFPTPDASSAGAKQLQ